MYAGGHPPKFTLGLGFQSTGDPVRHRHHVVCRIELPSSRALLPAGIGVT
jgi:hypothetical protein